MRTDVCVCVCVTTALSAVTTSSTSLAHLVRVSISCEVRKQETVLLGWMVGGEATQAARTNRPHDIDAKAIHASMIAYGHDMCA